MSDIDYRKLLKICLIKWLDAEGCCWSGYSFSTVDPDINYELSPEETKAVHEVIKEIDPAAKNGDD